MEFSKKIMEIFLFVNPLGPRCYETEKIVLDFVQERNEKVKLRFIPFVNFHTISTQLSLHPIKETTIETRNKLYMDTYETALAFTAVSMQGKNIGRQFLMALQKSLIEQQNKVSNKLISEIISSLPIDTEMFLEDWHADFTKQLFLKDQKIAREMDVSQTPSLVLFSSMSSDYGSVIESTVSKEVLHGLCDSQNQKIHNLSSKKIIKSYSN
ncbi:DsbA family protein [Lacticigenium naphthae]|uniref:DsbA family protein n=1 Tax=Lacticigenium naphthae TaxID=515351 RepID=UPI0004149B81|nr:DsbA family protein [Lacticigenium naphthae]